MSILDVASWPDQCWFILCCFKAGFDLVIRLVGPIFLLLGMTMMSACGYVFFAAVLPYWTPYNTPLGILHTIWSLWLVFNFVWNYLFSVFSSPGISPDFMHTGAPLSKEEIEELKTEEAPKKGQGFSKFCKRCKKPKPPRSHHCHICGSCVLKMDHHCRRRTKKKQKNKKKKCLISWVNNCVGHSNHRYFNLFLLYLFVSCLWVAYWTYFLFVSNTAVDVAWPGIHPRATTAFTFMITVSLSIGLLLMFIWQFYLSISNQTTIEFYFNRWQASENAKEGKVWRNRYNLGWKKNFQQFYDVENLPFWFLRWCLPSLRGSAGDGVVWTTRLGPFDNFHQQAEHMV